MPREGKRWVSSTAAQLPARGELAAQDGGPKHSTTSWWGRAEKSWRPRQLDPQGRALDGTHGVHGRQTADTELVLQGLLRFPSSLCWALISRCVKRLPTKRERTAGNEQVEQSPRAQSEKPLNPRASGRALRTYSLRSGKKSALPQGCSGPPTGLKISLQKQGIIKDQSVNILSLAGHPFSLSRLFYRCSTKATQTRTEMHRHGQIRPADCRWPTPAQEYQTLAK